MSEDGFRVFIPDPTHGEGIPPDAGAGGPSEEFRRKLEAEFGGTFEFVSIGTGAAHASYVTDLMTAEVIAVHALYAGKAVKDVFDGWSWVYQQLSKFFQYEPTFDREAAAILVYKAVVDKMDGIPNTYQLKGFTIQNWLAFPDASKLHDPGPLAAIDPPSDRVRSAQIYVFQVVTDQREFRVAVDGLKTVFLQE